jgi:NADH-ubiquinone oxidoreductase chain 4L
MIGKTFYKVKKKIYFGLSTSVIALLSKVKQIIKNKKNTMNLSLILFLIGILGFVLNRKNIILMLISIEIMLLAITFLILVSSLSFDDILGQTFAIYIIAIAGAESAIGLGILVAFYRLRGSIAIEYK